MRTDPAASLVVFHNTIKERISGQFHVIESIGTYGNRNYQLESLESAASLLKDTCAREVIKLIEHAKSYPEKFEKESLTIEAFNKMIDGLRHLIYKCIDKINAIKIKGGDQMKSFDRPDAIERHINQIDHMLNKFMCYSVSENKYSLMSLSIFKITNHVISGKVMSIHDADDLKKSAVLGVVCINSSALSH